MATLNDTTDAMVWAEEFTRIFDGHTIHNHSLRDNDPGVDPGTMVTWFANAIETGRSAGRKEACSHVDTFDLPDETIVCRTCGTLDPLIG